MFMFREAETWFCRFLIYKVELTRTPTSQSYFAEDKNSLCYYTYYKDEASAFSITTGKEISNLFKLRCGEGELGYFWLYGIEDLTQMA